MRALHAGVRWPVFVIIAYLRAETGHMLNFEKEAGRDSGHGNGITSTNGLFNVDAGGREDTEMIL